MSTTLTRARLSRSGHRTGAHGTGTGTPTSRRSSTLTGLGTVLRLEWRRNRLFYTMWLLGLLMLLPATVSKYHELVPVGTNPQQMLELLGQNPTMRAILGPPYDLMQPGGFAMWRVGTFTAAALAMMAALGVIRATRAEEEEGRVELIRMGVVGRHAPLAAGVLLALLACLVFTVLQAAALIALDTPVAGSIAASAGMGLTGAVFAGVAAVCAQIFESARAARAWALGAVLGGLYLLRAIIDGSGDGNPLEPLRWVVPLEWAALVRPYAGERWWVLLLPVLLTIGLVQLAFRLENRRDHGAGLKATGLGRAGGAPYLRNAWGLAWRLQRGSIYGWTIGILVSAAGMGSLALSMDELTEGSTAVAEMMRKMGGSGALREAFYMAMIGIVATIIALCGVVLLNRLRTEEDRGHAEVMLATDTSRTTFALSHLVWALGVPSVLLVLTGALLPVGQVAAEGGSEIIADLVRAALVLLPGLWFTVGLGMFLIGWAPRAFGLVWVLLVWTMFCTWVAVLFDIPDWVLRLQPWGHLPHLPAEAMSWPPVLIEGALALALLGFGLVGYRRRSIVGR